MFRHDMDCKITVIWESFVTFVTKLRHGDVGALGFVCICQVSVKAFHVVTGIFTFVAVNKGIDKRSV